MIRGLLLCWPLMCNAAADWTDALLQQPVVPSYWPAPDGRQILLASVDPFADKPAPAVQLLGQAFHPDWPLELSQPLYQRLQLAHISTNGVRLDLLTLPGPVVDFQWSADSSQLAVVILQQQSSGAQLRLWRYLPKQQHWQQWPAPPLSGHGGKPLLVWAGDQLIIRTAQQTASCELSKTQAVHKKSVNQSSQQRLYRDLVDTPQRHCQFIQARQQQLLLLSGTGQQQPLDSGLIHSFSVSPDGQYLLVSKITQPLAAGLKLDHQGRDYHVIHLSSRQQVQQLPAQQAQAIRGDEAPAGARLVQWRADQPATLLFTERGERGQPSDMIKQWSAPFQQPATAVLQLPQRLYRWFSDSRGGLVLAGWNKQQQQMSWYLWQELQLAELIRFDYRQQQADPGLPYSLDGPDGRTVLIRGPADELWFQRSDGIRLHARPGQSLQAEDARSPWRPLYWPDPAKPEQMLAFSDSPAYQQQFWWVTAPATGQRAWPLASWRPGKATTLPAAVALSALQLQGHLYLPSAQCRQPLAVLAWLYPDPKVPQLDAVMSPLSPFFALRQCVAVLDLAGVEVPDAAELLALVRRHPALDPQRVVLMGHSYGANAVIELLAQSGHFAGGIARSGAYNRTLTPLGYQRQPQPLWQQTAAYLQESPLLRADRVRSPVLLVHGDADQNPGTLPLQSEQLFMVLQHQGLDAELLMLPAEGHQYQQRKNLQTLLHVQSEWLARVTDLPASVQQSDQQNKDNVDGSNAGE